MNMRITTSYEWANCYVFMELAGPELIAFDTVQIPLADVAGNWKGKVSGSMVENNVLFMKSVRFPQKGKHKITFVQGMRDQDLGEVSDIGLTIKKAD
jgi:gliding motility-associated lipoprotein GldH